MAVSEDTLQSLLAELKSKVNDRRLRERLPKTPRDAHALHHGLLQVEFAVRSDVPADLRLGVFAAARRYGGYVRFSNAGGDDHDAEVDFRGMAIKLMAVDGPRALAHLLPEDEKTTQDFILVNSPVFFVENPERMLDFLVRRRNIRAAKLEARKGLELELTMELARLYPRTRRAGIALNPLREIYFSQTPYKLGGAAIVKYRARPRRTSSWPFSEGSEGWARVVVTKGMSDVMRRLRPAHYLRSAMEKTLRRGIDIVFDFGIQRQTDATAMPSDDPTVEWDERRSPFVPVAEIRIPARENAAFDTRDALAEDISFNPWHSLITHEPVGSINEARRELYRRMAEYRHLENGVAYTEPAPAGNAPVPTASA